MGPLAQLENKSFDVAIVTYEILAMRTSPLWSLIKGRVAGVLNQASWKIALPQDDYTAFDELDRFLHEHEFDVILTPITQDWELLYPRCSRSGTIIDSVLTGYWESSLTAEVSRFAQPWNKRDIDVGQRIRLLPIYFGSEAQRKGILAESFATEAARAGFRVDVSTKEGDALIGDDWYRFLGRSKFTVGRIGGASVGDPKGNLAYKYKQLRQRFGHLQDHRLVHRLKLARYPNGNFTAVSPRIFEAAALGVAQILEDAEYFPSFEAGKHFIPLDPDLSNIHEVFRTMRDSEQSQAIAVETRKILIDSNLFSYQSFVDKVSSKFPASCQPLVGPSDIINNDSTLQGPSGEWIPAQELNRVRRYAALPNTKNLAGIPAAWRMWPRLIHRGDLDIRLLHLPWCSAFSAHAP